MTIEQLTDRRCQYYRGPITSKNGKKYAVSIANLYSYITNPDCYGVVTRQLRQLSAKEERRNFKATNLDYVLPSGLFDTRDDKGLTRHSGFQCHDLDDLDDRLPEVRQQLIDDPLFETALLFTSPSGNGLKWVVPIDLDRCDHRTWYYAIAQYLRERYGVESDRACVNVSRACFLCHDPEAYINPVINQ